MNPQIPLANCLDGPITPQLWHNLGLDHYLRNYPGGQNMTLSEYAYQVHAANFFCGLGRHCLAAKLDWLVLYSVQQWNFYMNSLYSAIEIAITMVRDVAASAICDFTPTETVKWMGLTISVGALSIIVLAAASALMIIGPTPFTLMSEVAAESAVASESGATAATAATGLVRRHHKETLSTDKFSAYAKLDEDITILHSKLKRVIYMNMHAILNSPISSDVGIYNAVKNGSFLSPNPSKPVLQESAQKLAQLTMISELFKSLKMFVVLGNEPCTHDGPNGALEGDDVLSYCNDEGLMMNIVRAQADKMIEKIPHANLLSSKYGFNTSFLATTAWSCQQKAGHFATIHTNFTHVDTDCTFTLPVCDTRLPDVRKKLDSYKGVVVACREGASLPI
ncbi:hypothetical protein O181_032402 [Austropuccinia psidii MF-1]|uniref:DUF7872 domain-containing protein n=1 Tax=Austropuccinia psidii MF-1 TaxID=1389203 RepID=A0A9Q3H679_9BASI|nr:hypothetical protein [Austropuccinia psidii MF-1]